ncbi:hypothetical protein SAMN04487983_10472 [Streptomyces sp. yr375]|nr:hypothetical protein [Streptomyces sp. yr375]SES38022.1 hypothetical protein SAMN04487983_10472 [Streptomyces sp. yr375]
MRWPLRGAALALSAALRVALMVVSCACGPYEYYRGTGLHDATTPAA